MRRVYAIWVVRKLLSPTVLKAGIIVVFVNQIASRVWVAKVFENAPSTADIVSFLNFFGTALYNTRTAVQLLSVATIFLAVWLLEDLFFKRESKSFI